MKKKIAGNKRAKAKPSDALLLENALKKLRTPASVSHAQRDTELLKTIKANLPELEALLLKVNDHWCYEDMVYRFYHHSFKVYWVQETTQEIVKSLEGLAPGGRALNENFLEVMKAGASGKQFQHSHNENWLSNTRVFLEAFFHAKFFLEMVVKYGKELEQAPMVLPSGWAAVLYLYNIR